MAKRITVTKHYARYPKGKLPKISACSTNSPNATRIARLVDCLACRSIMVRMGIITSQRGEGGIVVNHYALKLRVLGKQEIIELMGFLERALQK